MALTDEERKAHLMDLHSNPVLTEILDDIEQTSLIAWDRAAPMDIEGRERVWHERQAAQKVRSRIVSEINKTLTKSMEQE